MGGSGITNAAAFVILGVCSQTPRRGQRLVWSEGGLPPLFLSILVSLLFRRIKGRTVFIAPFVWIDNGYAFTGKNKITNSSLSEIK
jgi:hypothetical protein